MRHRYIRVGVTALVLALAFGGLLWATLREGASYFKNVDEVMASPAQWEGKRLSLRGYVVANSILTRVVGDSPEYKFKVQHNGHVIDAAYTGVVPDTFKDTPGREAEVVLKGRLTKDGFHVEKDGVVAKCPSKYEEAKKVG
jgi:cytochrome c-type biogenesis protein CcmE